MLSQVEAHASQTTTDRLDRQMLEAQGLKEVEAVASDKRMAELMAIEEARQAELKRQRAKKQQQERQMLIIVFAAVVLFLLTFFGYALLSGG
jgi:hypothetical protein